MIALIRFLLAILTSPFKFVIVPSFAERYLSTALFEGLRADGNVLNVSRPSSTD